MPDKSERESLQQTYLRSYERRVEAGKSQLAFSSAEPNALLTLALLRHATSGSGLMEAERALELIKAVTRGLVASERAHSLAIDMLGFVWAASYGSLPIRYAAIEQLEWTLESGSASGAVSGVLRSAWRAAFLAAAWPSLDWDHRPQAQVELTRRVNYLQERVAALAAGDAEEPALSQTARIAFAVALLGEHDWDDRLGTDARTLLATACAEQRADGAFLDRDSGQPASTSVLAQVTAAAEALGMPDVAEPCRRFIFEVRRDRERNLLRADDGADARYEFSPWVLLAFTQGPPDATARTAQPRRLRDLVRRRGRAGVLDTADQHAS